MDFIDWARTQRDDGGLLWRVEPVVQTLSSELGIEISKSGYYAFKGRPPSRRALSDEVVRGKISELRKEGYNSCYGPEKTWGKLNDDGFPVARCTVERLFREMGISGTRRGRKHPGDNVRGRKGIEVQDLVRRNFDAPAPDTLWVAGFTYVHTRSGWCYVAFVIDVFARRIVGHFASDRMDEEMVGEAFRRAVYNRSLDGRGSLAGVIHHNDKGSQYTSGDFQELLLSHGILSSVGRVGDSLDNALAETVNGSYKSELIWKHGPWLGLDDLRLETERFVDWFNNSRVSRRNRWKPPVEVERIWYSEGEDIRNLKKRKKKTTVH